MSKAKHSLAAAALVLVLGVSAAGISLLGRAGAGESEPYRALIPAPSPTVSVPADRQAPVQDYVAVPAPDSGAAAPEDAVGGTQDAAPAAPGNPEQQESAGPAATTEQLVLASRTAWDHTQQDRVAAALAAADAYAAAHPGTAEAAVYASVRSELACGSAADSTTLVTRALRSAGYNFTGCGPEEILSWFNGHPDYGTVLTDAGSARPGSLVVARGPSGSAVIGVYLSDGLAVFGADAADVAGAASGAVNAAAASTFIAPANLSDSSLLPAATAGEHAPVYLRPAPFA